MEIWPQRWETWVGNEKYPGFVGFSDLNGLSCNETTSNGMKNNGNARESLAAGREYCDGKGLGIE